MILHEYMRDYALSLYTHAYGVMATDVRKAFWPHKTGEKMHYKLVNCMRILSQTKCYTTITYKLKPDQLY